MIEAARVSVAEALGCVSFTVAPGEVVGLIGHNGSGKSTLGRLVCAAQLPDSGVVRVDGHCTAEEGGRARVRRLVGYVGQNPADQTVSTIVGDELAFGLRNIGCARHEVRERSRRALEDVGLAGFEEREVSSLSGGELQRLVLASVLAMEPAYIVLDEVTAQLDSSLRAAFRALVARLARAGIGVVLVTHDPLEVLLCDRVAVLSSGRVTWAGAPRALLTDGWELWQQTLMPHAFVRALHAALDAGYAGPLSCSPAALAAWARETGRVSVLEAAIPAVHGAARDAARGDAGLAIRTASVAYDGYEALHDLSLTVRAGQVTLVAGPSGAGKTTLACAAAGLLRPEQGSVLLGGTEPHAGDVGLAFQNPEEQLFLETVERELAFAPHNQGCAHTEIERRVRAAAARLDVEMLLEADPFQLSGGQARRVALASILTLEPRALVLDEPTSGLDAPSRAALHRLVRDLAAEGTPMLVVSHDLEEWLAEADEVALLRAGRLVWNGTPAELARDAGAFECAGLAAPESWQLAALLRDGSSPEGEDVRAAPAPVGDDARRAEGARDTAAASGPARDAAARPVRASLLSCVDARVKMLLLLAATIAVFAAGAPWALAVWCAVAIGALAASGMGARAVLRNLRPVLLLFVLIICANLVSCDGSADIVVSGSWGLSTAGAARAMTAIVRIVLLVCLALAVAISTTPTKLADACTALMRPLGRFGVPVADIGLVLSMALRFIPVVSEEAARIRLAQRARGVDFEGGSVFARVRAWATVLTPLVVGLFRRADRIAESMDARCYGQASQVEAPRVPLAARDRMVVAAGLGAMAALTVLSHLV